MEFSRLEAPHTTLATEQVFSAEYKEIIKTRDKSFYKNNDAFASNFKWVITHYTGSAYANLNQKLVKGNLSKDDKSFDVLIVAFAWRFHLT
jgi:hypothetical protein